MRSFNQPKFMAIITTDEGKEMASKKIYRSYTMSSTPTNTEYFEVTVKRVDGGVASNWLCDQIQVGSTLRMTGPHGHFTCAPNRLLKYLRPMSPSTPAQPL